MTMQIENENFKDGYYHIAEDIEANPDADIFIVWSRRGPGKTYSALRYPYYKGFKTLYMKRTKKDVQTVVLSDESIDFDASPWAPLNRDFNLNVKGRMLKDGIGAFYNADQDGNPTGSVVNYVASLNAIKTVKGMDLSDAEWIIMDEFIPQKGEITRRDEGDMLLDLYETVNRDRIKRGREPLKLILFANAEEISTHITNALEVVDDMAYMQAKGIHRYYNKGRGIYFHHISNDEFPVPEEASKRGLARAMQGTAWAAKAYEGEFSGNDFSNVVKMSLKNMRCMYKLHYRRHNDAYIYLQKNTGMWYMSSIKGSPMQSYDLDRENQQKKFWFQHGMDLKDACIDDRMKFEKYSYYDLIINYTKMYNL